MSPHSAPDSTNLPQQPPQVSSDKVTPDLSLEKAPPPHPNPASSLSLPLPEKADMVPPPSDTQSSSLPNGEKLGNGSGSDDVSSSLAGSEEAEYDELEEAPLAYHVPAADIVQGFGVDPRDANTPDRWIPRHPELIRLTGKHPFNSEPPLDRLVDQGFITPTSLHYVRNHGYVPQGDWATWRVEVTGKVAQPASFTMEDLISMPSRTLPVTLVCIGNRRKEQNMVKKSRGFNWGAAAVSTSVWKGVRLRDVLKKCGILTQRQGARFICFEGVETLPAGGGAKSSYGTSISRARAMDITQDVILAYEQNGESLAPDHGFPIRVIIPGYIGGRMVKWLKKIQVTEIESQNHFHFFDNRVMPSFVDSERADREGWWYKPEYLCNELSINSAAAAPAHNEELLLSTGNSAASYLLKGYAYSGGGRKVNRVEVTLDDGASWRLADLVHTEQPTEHGKWWCWCFWSLRVDVVDLLNAKEMAVRAWDEATNTQPEHLIWNVLGMMNNCWFRIKIHPVRCDQGLALRFEHPTVAGVTAGGWMDKEASAEDKQAAPAKISAPESVAAPSFAPLCKEEEVSGVKDETPGVKGEATEAAAAEKAVSKLLKEGDLKSYPMSEVEKHNSAESAWIVVHGKVYDTTKFLKDHPGGAESILINAGTDSTEEFDAIHSRHAKNMLAEYLIGELSEETGEEGGETKEGVSGVSGVSGERRVPGEEGGKDQVVPEAAEGVPGEKPVALDPRKRIPFKLIMKESLSHDVRRFRFGLQSENHVLGLPVGKHIMLCARINGKLVMRAYTPTSSNDEVGFFDLVVKTYFKNVHPNFPEGGLMSQHLDSLQIGDEVEVKGPIGEIEYKGMGALYVDHQLHQVKKMAMLAGGTGLTPMYQVIKAILKNEADRTEMWLLYANRTAEDILLRDELDAFAREQGHRFHVWYTIESPGPEGWEFSTGRVNEEMMGAHLPQSGPDTVALMCGPPGMIQFGCIPNLEKLGYAKSQMFSF